jgi:hypothetical protein
MRNTRRLTLFITLLGFAMALPTAAAQVPAKPVQSDSIEVFWQRFRGAVIKGDKAAVANMSQFPIPLPYGMGSIKTRAQLLRRYREVFNHEGSAAKCFEDAIPKTDPARPREFTVGCKNAAGDEVVIYSFAQTRNGWRFSGLDNINE